MKQLPSIILIILLFRSGISAQNVISQEKKKAIIDSVKLAQRKEIRSTLKARYDSMTPEQKKQFRDHIMNRADSLTPEQRARFKQRIKDMKTGNG